MVPIISGDIDPVKDAITLNYKLCSNAIAILNQIEDRLTSIRKNTYSMYNCELHRHNYHKHDSENGHSYHDGIVTKGNCGKSYLYTCRGHRPLVDILLMEYREAVDCDNNGLIFYHDFCFQYDPTLPLGLMKILESFHMPGYPKQYYQVQPDCPKLTSSQLWEQEYTHIHTGFDDDSNPTFVERNNPLQIITWDQYLKTLPLELYNQRKFLLRSVDRNRQ